MPVFFKENFVPAAKGDTGQPSYEERVTKALHERLDAHVHRASQNPNNPNLFDLDARFGTKYCEELIGILKSVDEFKENELDDKEKLGLKLQIAKYLLPVGGIKDDDFIRDNRSIREGGSHELIPTTLGGFFTFSANGDNIHAIHVLRSNHGESLLDGPMVPAAQALLDKVEDLGRRSDDSHDKLVQEIREKRDGPKSRA